MKNTFGQSVGLTVFGESHGTCVGVVIDGLPAGIVIDNEYVEKILSKRKPNIEIETKRVESDNFEILSGIFNGKTTGTPITIIIKNENVRSKDYQKNLGLLRPSHADYTANLKYHGFEDYRGGGHFSGRITAGIVASGGIFIKILENLGITIGSHILKCGKVCDREFENSLEDIKVLKERTFPVLSSQKELEMKNEIISAKEKGDSVGGIIQTCINGMIKGVGEPWFDSLESQLSHALFSIGGIKGVEFGLGFGFADKLGSEVNDEFIIKDGEIQTKTNNNGGINGGISNGMDITFNCAVKPTPSILKEQNTVNILTNKEEKLKIQGRHDPAIIRRICPVIESITAMVICDALAVRFGTDFLLNGGKI